MNIGIDLRYLAPGVSGGIAPLVKGVIEAMIRSRPQDHFHIFCTIFSRSLLDTQAENVTAYSFAGFNFYEQLTHVINQQNIRVLFRSFAVEDGPQFPLKQQIFLIPDLQHEAWPDFFDTQTLQRRRLAFNLALCGAGAIGTISNFARQTLVEHPWTQCRDIFLMPPALDSTHQNITREQLLADEIASLPDTPWFYFPANLWPHKNHRRLLTAFRQVVAGSDQKISLVLTGHPAGWDQLRQDFTDLPVRHLGFVRSKLVRYLMQEAVALCFFSLYEGFGMPVLEAFDARCPVLCSNTTSLVEVAGDAALSCDPTDTQAIAQCMKRILDEPKLRESLIEAGASRPALWSWQRSADHLHDAIIRVAAHDTSTPQTVHLAQHKPAIEPSIKITDYPTVSIVTPSYNQGRFLRRTIESVLTQDYPHIDYRVIDGGSTDESVDILKSYANRFPWVSEKDHGQSHAINKGFAQSTGQLRGYLNSDDVLRPGAIRTAVDHFLKRPEIDMIYGRAEYINENDEFLQMYRTAPYSFDHLANECIICQPAAFWTSRIAHVIGLFDESLHYAMDYDYWLRIDRAGGRIAHVGEILACSRLYAETKTLSMREKIFNEVLCVTQRHTGRAPLSYFCGLWHHRATERRDTPISFLGHLSPVWKTAALIHYLYYNAPSHSTTQVLRSLGIHTRHWLWTRKVVQATSSRIGLLAVLAERHKKVRGIYADNWIAPHAIVSLQNRLLGTTIYFRGSAPVNSTLSIRANRKILTQQTLAGGQENTIQFTVPQDVSRIELRFSDYAIDPARRKLCFLINDTNCFSESDMA